MSVTLMHRQLWVRLDSHGVCGLKKTHKSNGGDDDDDDGWGILQRTAVLVSGAINNLVTYFSV